LRERSGLLANSVCFVISKCVLRCFAVFCGCFAGVLSRGTFWNHSGVLRVFFVKNSVLRCFAGVLSQLLDVFCECLLCEPFLSLSERKMCSIVLRCIRTKRILLCVLCVYLYIFCAVVLCCCVRKTLKTRSQNTAKHHKTPQNTAKRCF